MKKLMPSLPVLIILVSLSCSGPQVNLIAAQEKQKGITYACWWGTGGCYAHPGSKASLSHLAETGANWISLIVDWYQDNLRSTRISAGVSTPTDADLMLALNQAHALGLKVMLKPHLVLANDPSHWKGQIGEGFTAESEWSEWFASYHAFIEHYADFATTYGADLFCVGCELKGTTHRAADWRKVVAGVRSRYTGPLVYASTHGKEAVGITWWDALDFIGIDAYYSLSRDASPTLKELTAAWKPIVSSLASLASKWQKPLILTEIGYRSMDGAAAHPSNWKGQGNVNLKEQADGYEAAFETVYQRPWLAGMYWWSWSPNPLEGGPDDSGYSPHNKPAEGILKKWYGGSISSSKERTIKGEGS